MTKKTAKKIEQVFGVSYLWTLEGIGSMHGNEQREKSDGIILVGLEVLAGLQKGIQIEAKANYETIKIPRVKNQSGLIATKISGKSMDPLFLDGALLVLKKMIDIAEFRNNSPYVIFIEGIALIKNLLGQIPWSNKNWNHKRLIMSVDFNFYSIFLRDLFENHQKYTPNALGRR